MKKYKIKPTPKQIKIIKKYWLDLEEEENRFDGIVRKIETAMEVETGIKGIEFFHCDGAYVGVGNADKTMKLLHIR